MKTMIKLTVILLAMLQSFVLEAKPMNAQNSGMIKINVRVAEPPVNNGVRPFNDVVKAMPASFKPNTEGKAMQQFERIFVDEN